MTIEEAERGFKRLKASYPTMSKIDELTTAAYLEEIGAVKWEDFAVGMKVLVRTSKFFPSISEIVEACDDACRKRIEAKDHEEREERLAIQAGEDAIMDPKSGVHRVVVGPKHQEFLDYLEGRKVFPEPEWMSRKGKKGTRSWAEGEAYQQMMPAEERARRVDLLKQQARMLLAEELK
jgi:hypothetical protein